MTSKQRGDLDSVQVFRNVERGLLVKSRRARTRGPQLSACFDEQLDDLEAVVDRREHHGGEVVLRGVIEVGRVLEQHPYRFEMTVARGEHERSLAVPVLRVDVCAGLEELAQPLRVSGIDCALPISIHCVPLLPNLPQPAPDASLERRVLLTEQLREVWFLVETDEELEQSCNARRPGEQMPGRGQ